MRFENKAVVVTGGGAGIGFAIAKQLYEEGAVVAILGRREEKLQIAKREITGSDISDRFLCYGCDVSKSQMVREVFGDLREHLQQSSVPLYGLVNNAGVPCRKNLLATTPEDLERTFAINVFGAVYCAQAALEQMLEHAGGSIVNIASVGGLQEFNNRLPYNMSKAAVLSFTRSIARPYARQGIRVNSVCPGYVRTEMTALFFDTMPPEKYEALVSRHAIGRLVLAEEVAKEVCFLLSEDASSTTGTHRVVDGGWLLGK